MSRAEAARMMSSGIVAEGGGQQSVSSLELELNLSQEKKRLEQSQCLI